MTNCRTSYEPHAKFYTAGSVVRRAREYTADGAAWRVYPGWCSHGLAHPVLAWPGPPCTGMASLYWHGLPVLALTLDPDSDRGPWILDPEP